MEAEGFKDGEEFLIPATARLFKAIQGLLEVKHMVSSIMWFKSGWVVHIQHLIVI